MVGAVCPDGGELRLWDGRSLAYEPQTLAAGLQPIMNVALAPAGGLAAVVYDGEPQAQLVDLAGSARRQPVGGETMAMPRRPPLAATICSW